MLTTPEAPSFPPELRRALDAEGEEEYRQLLRVTRTARGSFFLFLIESDYSPAARDMLLDCLHVDLNAEGLRLRRVTLTAGKLDLFRLPELETPVAPDEAIVLVGIENTPGLVREPGRKPERPPIYALLNRLRETLHARLPVPFLVWCIPSVYTGLQTHAPDFFDHYTGLFQFMDSSLNVFPNLPQIPTDAPARLLPAFLSPAAAKSAVAFYEQQVAQHPASTRERAHVLLGLADALLELHGPDYPQHIRRTLHLVAEALALLSPEDDAREWANAHRIKGIAYYFLPTGDRTQNLQQAISCYEVALRILTDANFPYDWAMTQNSLGNAYCFLPVGELTQNLLHALNCFQAALCVYTETSFPQEWARTQNSIGIVYSDLPTGDRTQNLRQAIACYEAALRVRIEADFPYDWAMTQCNLGLVYGDLSTDAPTQNLQQAIACYKAALRVYTETDFPQEWARTQCDLGNAYSYLPTGDRTQNLLHAIDYYKAALHITTKVDFPQEWARTQFNLAFALRDLGNEAAARRALHRAIAGYRQVGLKTGTKRAESMLRRLRCS